LPESCAVRGLCIYVGLFFVNSRSHTVFSINVQIKENSVDSGELLKRAKLNLVDLAASENVKRSGAADRIELSLSATTS
jgi:hypothetical protein